MYTFHSIVKYIHQLSSTRLIVTGVPMKTSAIFKMVYNDLTNCIIYNNMQEHVSKE